MTEIARSEILERIENAKSVISEAQRALASAISEIESRDRAEKRHVGEPLGMALDRLRVALTELATLEDLLAD